MLFRWILIKILVFREIVYLDCVVDDGGKFKNYYRLLNFVVFFVKVI